MASVVVEKGLKARQVVVRDAKGRRLSVAALARALGGRVGAERVEPGSPVGLIALREQVGRLLRSSGGRPGLQDSQGRQKIPLHKGDWERLKDLARAVADEEKSPTPGQMASFLLHQAIVETERRIFTRAESPVGKAVKPTKRRLAGTEASGRS